MSRGGLLLCGLLVLTLFAAALRLRGIDYLLPLEVEPDADVVVQVHLLEGRAAEPERDPSYGAYPHLLAWAAVALTEPAPAPGSGASRAEHLAAARAPVLRVRRVVAWLSLLVLPAAWLLARRFVPAGWALVATAFTATSLLAVHFATQARPHAPAMALGTLAVLACTSLARRGRLRDYALAGGAVALGVGTLQSGIALCFPLLAAHLVAVRRARGSLWLAGGRRAALLLVPLGALGASLRCFYPFLFIGGSNELELGKTIAQSHHRLYFGMFNGRGFGTLARAAWSYEPLLSAAGALALAVFVATRFGARRAPRSDGADVAVVLAYTLPYALVCGLYERVYERFLLPLLPFLATFAAWGLYRIHAAGRVRALCARGLTAALLAPTALVAWRLSELRVAPDTLERAGAWLEAHADPAADRLLLTRCVRLPLFRSRASEEQELEDTPLLPAHAGLSWVEYQHYALGSERPEPAWNAVWFPARRGMYELMAADPERYVASQSGDFVVAEVFARGRHGPVPSRVHWAIQKRGELVMRCSPDGERRVSEHPLTYQDPRHVETANFAWRVWRAESLGPVVEIYRW